MARMPALTRSEARDRAALLDVHDYTVDLDLTAGGERFRSTTVISFTAREAGATFAELRPAALLSAELDGVPLPAGGLAGGRLELEDLAPGAHRLRVAAEMAYSRVGEGMHRFDDPADGRTYLYTQGFMNDAPRVYACFDQPDLKAVFCFTVTAPEGWTILGNGRAEQTEPGRWVCARTPPISTYLTAIVAGPYHSVRTEHAGLPFGLHVRRSLADALDADAEELLEITRRCFDRYRRLLDEPYPFDSYDQAFVPEFNAGAMENPGLVTLRDEYIRRSASTSTERRLRGMVVAHEMAHMWFGDLVTLRWWDDVWLNESFAEYMGYQVLDEATAHTGMWTDFAVETKPQGYDADQRPSTHPVAPERGTVLDTAVARTNFDGISYAKGASALRQLVAWIGEKAFLAGINEHFARHRFGNAELADFLDSLSTATDRDISAWAQRWLGTTGVDTLTPDFPDEQPPGGWTAVLHHSGSRPHRLLLGAYDLAPADGGRLVPRERRSTELAADGGESTVGGTGARPDLLLLNDGDLTYAKVRFDAHSWRTVRHALSGLPDPLSRGVVWNAARDMVRDGELPPLAYVETLLDHLPRETDSTVVHHVLAFARDPLADRYLAPEERRTALDLLSSACTELLSATAGDRSPDLRLTAVRHAIDNATTPEPLRAWREEGTVPGGPRLDHELRWRLLLRLCVLGAATSDEIDAELAADSGASGRESAARCKAALPLPEAKAAAWSALFEEPDTLSNRLFAATARGFWQPEQNALLGEFRDRYPRDAVALAHRRGQTIGEAAGRHAFPASLVDDRTLRLVEECAAPGVPAVPAGLHRRLVDQLDELGRALRVRSRVSV